MESSSFETVGFADDDGFGGGSQAVEKGVTEGDRVGGGAGRERKDDRGVERGIFGPPRESRERVG